MTSTDGAMTFSIMALSIMDLILTLNKHKTEHKQLIGIFLSVITLNVSLSYCYVERCYAEWNTAECRYAECRYAECRYAECRYAECRYAECRYAEDRGTQQELRQLIHFGQF
jgi:hypothetical protein